MPFDYEGALQAGYSYEEIENYLASKKQFDSFKEKHSNFDYEGALQAGYSEKEIEQHVRKRTEEERSPLEKAGRVAGQYALGAIEATPIAMAYDISALPLSSKEAQNVAFRETVFEDIERLSEQKLIGQWDEQDQKLLDHLIDLAKNPQKSMQYVQTLDVGIKDIAEKVTGTDLKPEGILETSAQWAGFLKNPQKILDLNKSGVKGSEILKNLMPTGTEAVRSIGAATGLELAKDNEFGPIGTIAAAIAGDLIGGGVAGAGKGLKNLITQPKETLAKTAARFTKKDKLELQKQLIQDFREAGIQADVGTLTDSSILKMTQARLAESGLTGQPLEELRLAMTNQIVNEYKGLAKILGESRYATMYEAGETAKKGIEKIRDKDLDYIRSLYKEADASLSSTAVVDSRKLAKSIENIEKNLKPGSLKSEGQRSVLNILDKVKSDIYNEKGQLKYVPVKELMNTKIALNDIINYEVQGGTKGLLKQLVGDVDRAIISHGKENIPFARNYIKANARFSKHAKDFRNKDVNRLLFESDPTKLMNRMSSVHGIKQLENVLTKTPEGKEIFDSLKRFRLDQMMENNLIDSTTQQIKLGTFSKLLEKGKNKEIVKELLTPSAFKKLQRLQKNSGKLAETAQKFLNTSKSASVAIDTAFVGNLFKDLFNALSGNPWGLMKSGALLSGGRRLSSLIADPEFLKLVEETILASEANNISLMMQLGERIYRIAAKELIEENRK